MKTPMPVLRGDQYYIRRRVPARYAAIDERDFVQVSLHTDSLIIAKSKAAEVWRQMVEAWEAKLDGHHAEGATRMKAARNLAQRRGYRYMDASDVARLPIEEILTRVEVDGRQARPSRHEGGRGRFGAGAGASDDRLAGVRGLLQGGWGSHRR